MNRSRIGFITSGSGGNPTGIGNYVTQLSNVDIPAIIACNDGDVGIGDALATGKDNHVLLFRVVRDGTEQWAVPDYNLTPEQAAIKHWQKIRPYFNPNVVANKDKIWIQPVNEVDDQNHGSWLGYFGVEIAKIANSEGYKVMLFGFASGTPEAETWTTDGMVAYLNYCVDNHDMAGVAVHEYDYSMEGMPKVYPFHVGRFEALYNFCDNQGIKRPKIIISEFGWAYNNIPDTQQVFSDIHFANSIYTKYVNVLGATIWYLGPGFSNIANKVQPLIAPLTDYTLNNTWPDPDPPPIPTDPTNILLNPSFEKNSYMFNGIQEIRVPDDWGFWFAPDSVPNPYDSNPWSVWRQPEARLMTKADLPANEQDLFVQDGNKTWKIFKGNGSMWFYLRQPLDAGKYKLTLGIFPDVVVGYDENGQKIFANDPNSCIVWIETPTGKTAEQRPTIGEFNYLTFEFDMAVDGNFKVHVMQPFATQNNGSFLDNHNLEEIEEEPMTWQERIWQKSYDKQVLAYKKGAALQVVPSNDGFQVATNEYDDVNDNGEAIRCRGAIHPVTGERRVYYVKIPIWNDVKWINTPTGDEPDNFFDNPVGVTEPPTGNVYPLHWLDVNPIGNLYFLNGRNVYHPGADLNLNWPVWNSDELAPVYSIGNGIVTWAGALPSTWGNVVIIKHDNGYFSRYAHLEDFNVVAGQRVSKGENIGRIGDAFDQLSAHLHFEISPTAILGSQPAYWPGEDLLGVAKNFVEPRSLIRLSRNGFINKKMYVKSPANLRSGPNTSFRIYQTLPTGTVLDTIGLIDDYYLSKTASGLWGWVHNSLVTVNPPTPNTIIRGVDQPASSWYWSTARQVFDTLKNEVWPKFHTNGDNINWYDVYKHPTFNVCRVVIDKGFNNPDPNAIFNEVKAQIAPWYAKDPTIRFELFNEPNIEHNPQLWSNGTQFGQTFRTICQMLKTTFPNIRIYYPGLSPQFGAYKTFLNDSKAVGAFDYVSGVCMHVYTAVTDNIIGAINIIIGEVQTFIDEDAAGKPLIISEMSVNRPASGTYKAQVYKFVWEALQGVEAAYCFTASWHPDPDINQEGFLEHGIHTALAQIL